MLSQMEGEFSEDQSVLVNTLGIVASGNLQRAYYYEDLIESQARTEAALEISRAVSTEVETKAIIDKITKVIRSFDRIFQFLYHSMS